MSQTYPVKGIAQKLGGGTSVDGGTITDTITIAADRYGIVYKLWVYMDVASETDLENLPASLAISASVGSMAWGAAVHPLILHVDTQTVVVEHRTVDLGPWSFDFGPGGLYSGIPGDNIIVVGGPSGTGNKTSVVYMYSD